MCWWISFSVVCGLMDQEGGNSVVVVVEGEVFRALVEWVSNLELTEEEKWEVLQYYLLEYHRAQSN